jgi:hypothetical protein
VCTHAHASRAGEQAVKAEMDRAMAAYDASLTQTREDMKRVASWPNLRAMEVDDEEEVVEVGEPSKWPGGSLFSRAGRATLFSCAQA